MLKEDYLKRQFTKRQFHYVFENTGLEDFPYMHLYSAFEIGQGRLVWNSVLERHDLVPFDLLYLAAKKFTKFDKPEAILLCQSWFDLRNDPIEQEKMVRLYCFEIAPSIEAALSFLDSEGDKLHCKRKIITELKDLMEEKRLPVDAKVAGQDSKLDSGSSSINFIKYQTQRLNQFLENIPIPVKGAVSLILFAIGVVRMLKNKFGPIWLQIMKKRLITTLVQAARPRF